MPLRKRMANGSMNVPIRLFAIRLFAPPHSHHTPRKALLRIPLPQQDAETARCPTRIYGGGVSISSLAFCLPRTTPTSEWRMLLVFRSADGE